MAKTDSLTFWAREIEFHLARAIARSEAAVADLEGVIPPAVVTVAADVLENLVCCRENLNFLILLIGKWEKREE